MHTLQKYRVMDVLGLATLTVAGQKPCAVPITEAQDRESCIKEDTQRF